LWATATAAPDRAGLGEGIELEHVAAGGAWDNGRLIETSEGDGQVVCKSIAGSSVPLRVEDGLKAHRGWSR